MAREDAHDPGSLGSLARFRFLTNDAGFYPVGEVAHIATIAEFGGENQVLGAGEIDVDRPGRIMIGHRRGS